MPTDTVVIVNKNWERVTVNARKGNFLDPNLNTDLGERELARNQNWTLYSDGESIHYRRDRDPGNPDGAMTDFVHRPCYATGKTYEESV